MYMLVADKDGVAGVTVWGDTVQQLMTTPDIIGRAITIPGCSISSYKGKRSLNVPRNHIIQLPDASPHLDWWEEQLQAVSLTTKQIQSMQDNTICNLFAVCAGMRREERTQGKNRYYLLLHRINTNTAHSADGTMKTVTTWTMVDEHGEMELRDWSGAVYQDADYVDKTIRIRRVRVHSAVNSPMKFAEFLPGRNGTKVIIAPRCAMLKWWLGDKYNEAPQP